jgi:plastocyanin
MKRILCALALTSLTLTGAARAEDAPNGAHDETPAHAEQAHRDREVQKLTFTNQLVGGKKTWLPATATVKAGEKLEITLVNELKDPHGFRAAGLLADAQVVGGGATKTVVVDAPKAGTYKFDCQLHPAHVGGQITVQ